MSKMTRSQLAAADWESLMGSEQFKRTLYTIFETCGMFTGNFHSDGRIHAMSEGRRSLGLDILRTAERAFGPTALQAVLDAETKSQQEVTYDRSDYIDDRDAELDPDGNDGKPRRPGSGLVYISYANAP